MVLYHSSEINAFITEFPQIIYQITNYLLKFDKGNVIPNLWCGTLVVTVWNPFLFRYTSQYNEVAFIILSFLIYYKLPICKCCFKIRPLVLPHVNWVLKECSCLPSLSMHMVLIWVYPFLNIDELVGWQTGVFVTVWIRCCLPFTYVSLQ